MKSNKDSILYNPLFSRAITLILSVWILGFTITYFINVPWGSFTDEVPNAKKLVIDALKFHWVPVFLSHLPSAFYALILNAIAVLTGNRILRWFRVDLDSNINKIIFSITLGWGIYYVAIFFLGISHLLYKEAVFCFLTLLGILSILEVKRFFKEWKAIPATSRYKVDTVDLVFFPVIIIFLIVQLVISFGPVWTVDALVYHMSLPKLYAEHHALVYVPGFLFSTFPALAELLFLLGLITSDEILAKFFSFSISTIFLITMFSIGNRHLSKVAGYLAVLILLATSPYFSAIFSEPWIDIALGLFSLLGIYAFFMWIEERKDGYLYLTAVIFGLAAATKLHGLFFVLLFFIAFLVAVQKDRKFLKKLAWCILAVCIIALPWYIRSWWLSGDPLFPFFYEQLGVEHWNKFSNECLWAYFSSLGQEGAKSFSDFIRINKNLFLGRYGITFLSPVIAIFLIPVLITVWNCNRLIKYLFFTTLLCYAFFIVTSPDIRFFYVGLAILNIIIAHILTMIWAKYFLTRIPIILCIATFIAISFFHSAKWVVSPFFTGLGVIDRNQFLTTENHDVNLKESYRAAMWINENLPQDSKILTWYIQGYHIEREYVRVNPAVQGVPDFGKISDTQTFLKNIKEMGITHLIYKPNSKYIMKPVQEFLDKCIHELLESGRITSLQQIDSCTIYSVAGK